MPTYTYLCIKCKKNFELFSSIRDYDESPRCIHCKTHKAQRDYEIDLPTQSSSVKKSDSELKTIGDLALRNTDRMSNDQKTELYMKHNSYKENKVETKPLPKGMSRIKKPPKPKWR